MQNKAGSPYMASAGDREKSRVTQLPTLPAGLMQPIAEVNRMLYSAGFCYALFYHEIISLICITRPRRLPVALLCF